jgi:hypothetical protein
MTTTANPNLTDAECDAILKNFDVRLDRNAVRSVDWVMYRSSQYPSLMHAQLAFAQRAAFDVAGYYAAFDTLDAMSRAVDMMDHRASEDDVRIVVSINERTSSLRECALADATREIHRYMIRQGWYTILPSN